MKSNSRSNHNEILAKNIQVVSVEKRLLEDKMSPNCFTIYPHYLYSSFMWVNYRRIPDCDTDILAKTYTVSQVLLMQVLTFKNQTHVDVAAQLHLWRDSGSLFCFILSGE